MSRRPLWSCSTDGCPRGPRWLYVSEYNQEEGYVRLWACDVHFPKDDARAMSDATALDPTRFPDVHLPVGVGWPS